MVDSTLNDPDYLKKAIEFFEKFQWLYTLPTTKVLYPGALDEFPPDWLDSLRNIEIDKLNNLVAKKQIEVVLPETLINFIVKCKKFDKLPIQDISAEPQQLPKVFAKFMSDKKKHEIYNLSKVINDHCRSSNISLIIDLGAGLGYIGQLLHYLYGYKVLALESRQKNIDIARNRQNQYFPESKGLVKYVCCNVTKDSLDEIENILKTEFSESSDEKVCLIGLHACGDLSVNMSNLYLNMKQAHMFILVSCCYHKLEQETAYETGSSENCFKGFPLSNILKNALKKSHADVGKLFGRTFMRLACQETPDRWENMSEQAHDEHAFHVLARAVLELYTSENGFRLKKHVCKATRKTQCGDFESYLKDSMNRYSLHESESDKVIPWTEEIEESIKRLWNEKSSSQKDVELYTGLQYLLQNAAESLVLVDRLFYLKENSVDSYLLPTMNRSLSPRCYAIVSTKKN
ncbi:protein RRNAD1-like [Trichogramma pretiosum]|uniref:protein RRNAD1-like n=1 Tax=Trichogramma pretiosum TaxID=7493 RepID=UPI0006C9D77D|nr:protein RRNAD1-like [Trichogramma pretiosum]